MVEPKRQVIQCAGFGERILWIIERSTQSAGDNKAAGNANRTQRIKSIRITEDTGL